MRFHPNLAEVYRQKVARLRDELNRHELRSQAAEVIRGLIKEIRLTPENGQLQIELAGNLAEILAFANKSPGRGPSTGARITLVAAEGLEPPTRGL